MFWSQYPKTNFHELNLDWILAEIKKLEYTMDTFVSVSTVKYADPFQWNITTQYEVNTIVMDPNTGIAYISVQPVPAGISISNTAYWTAVFDLSQMFTAYNDNLTFNNEELNITSAHAYTVGDWVIWKNELYIVTSNISIGDVLDPNTNIERKCVEELIAVINSNITSLDNRVTVLENQVIPKYSFETVSDMTDATDLVAGDIVNTAGYYAHDDGGAGKYFIRAIDPSDTISVSVDGTTSAQGLVRLPDDLCAELISDVVNVLQYGIKNDGITPGNTLIDSIITYNRTNGIKKNVYFPAGTYLFSTYLQSIRQETATLPIIDLDNIELYGDGKNSIIKTENADVIQLNGVSNIKIHDIALTGELVGSPTYGINGISVTNGSHDIEIYRVYAFDLPEYTGGGYVDGSKAFTCQTGSTSPGDIYNVTVKDCSCDNCAFGFECSGNSVAANQFISNILIQNNVFNVFYQGLSISGYISDATVPASSNITITGNIFNGFALGAFIGYRRGVNVSNNVFESAGVIDARVTGIISTVDGIQIYRAFNCIISNNTFKIASLRSYIFLKSTYVGDNYDMVIDGNMFVGGTQTSSYPINTYRYDDAEGGGYPEYCSFTNNKCYNHAVICNPVVKTSGLNNYIAGQVD